MDLVLTLSTWRIEERHDSAKTEEMNLIVLGCRMKLCSNPQECQRGMDVTEF
jgi:hypothetical protein